MGQKVNPNGFRLGVNRTWSSRWFSKSNYAKFLHQDLEIKSYVQKKLKNARVLVIGAGGLGSPVLQYLGACGVGVIGIIDNDLVDNSNLHRQVIYPDSAIGENKVFAAAEVIKSQNPFVEVLTFNRFFNEAEYSRSWCLNTQCTE